MDRCMADSTVFEKTVCATFHKCVDKLSGLVRTGAVVEMHNKKSTADPGPSRDLGSGPGARSGTPWDFHPIGFPPHAGT